MVKQKWYDNNDFIWVHLITYLNHPKPSLIGPAIIWKIMKEKLFSTHHCYIGTTRLPAELVRLCVRTFHPPLPPPPPAFSPPIYPSTHSFNQPLIHLTHHPINHPPPSIHWSIYPTIHLTLNQPSIHLFTHTPNHPPTRAPTFLYIAPLRARCNAKVSSLSVWSIHSDTFSASFSKSYNQVYLCAILMLNVILLEVWK